MGYSIRFRHDALSVFCTSDGSNYDNRLIDSLSLDTNNVYRLNLVVDIKENEIEIPVVAREHFENIIRSKLLGNCSNVEKLILPLYDNSRSQSRRTFDSILRQIFYNTGYSSRLQKIVTNKGEVYYGGKGIILDENFNPLLMCTLLAKIVDYEEVGKRSLYYRPVCYVHPKVFEEPTKLLNKGIITKLIPFYTNVEIDAPHHSRDHFLNNFEDKKVKVVIDNFDRFFTRPIKPTPSTCSNEVLNECLVDNVEDIIMML